MQPGVAALFAAAGREPRRATAFDFGFALGPRINAAGRLADMTLGIECLLTDDAARAAELAAQLDAINRERREVESGMREQAEDTLAQARLARLQAMLSDMDVRVRTTEKKLDDTIQETVRTKAKLRSQENKAEAASNLAEEEGALKTLKGTGAGVEKHPEFARAAALAATSADALKKENYSGSLYVANQVKAMVKELSERSQARAAVPDLEGETPFARPLTLKIAVAGKIREQPSHDSAVAWSVDRGASVLGHAHKGLWIRVQGEGQRWGWLFYDLLAVP